MPGIAANARIQANPALVLAAVTTSDGFRRWWTDDAEVDRAIGRPAIFRFAAIEVTFLIDRLDGHGIEMTCVDHKSYPGWLDTHLALRVIPDSGWTYVDMLHDGFRDRNGCFSESHESWTRGMTSLRAYCETGRGTPYVTSGSEAARRATPWNTKRIARTG
jgi:uncharacterized protein YndB with AHSA1/START domain